jgi:prepilin-type N-terminal cleavage/methylation domain-containing protein
MDFISRELSLSKVRPAQVLCRSFRGYSLAEMIWVVALIGVLASLAIPQFGSGMDAAKLAAARQKVEMLNEGLSKFAHAAGYQISRTPMSSGADEILVVRDLQSRSEEHTIIGSPFVDPTYNPASSSSTSDYRILWTSNFTFKLLLPGQSGTGLKIPFDGSDIGPPWVTPAGYNPGGR